MGTCLNKYLKKKNFIINVNQFKVGQISTASQPWMLVRGVRRSGQLHEADNALLAEIGKRLKGYDVKQSGKWKQHANAQVWHIWTWVFFTFQVM